MTAFGWCLTAQHEQCIVTSVDGKRTCDCTCENHGTDPYTFSGASESMQVIIAQYYGTNSSKK